LGRGGLSSLPTAGLKAGRYTDIEIA
jgi:hypothetical protein